MKTKMTMSSRLALGYSVIMLLLLFFVSILLYHQNERRISAETENSLMQINNSVVTQMDNWLHGMDYTAIEMANSKRFLDLWQIYCGKKTEETGSDVKEYLLKTIRSDSSIRRLAIFDENGSYCATGIVDADKEKVMQRVAELKERYDFENDYTRVFVSPGQDFWNSQNKIDVLSVIRPIVNTAGEQQGFLEVSMKASYFEKFLNSIELEDTPVSNIIIWGSKKEIFYSNFTDDNYTANELKDSVNNYEQIQEFDDYLVALSLSDYFNCRLLTVLNRNYIHQEVMKVSQGTLCIVCAFLLIGLAMLFWFSKYELHPIARLVQHMEKFHLGDKEEFVNIQVHDYETEILVNTYKNMTDRLKDNLETMNKMNALHVSTLFSTLQREIQPHFLYNTLGSIAYLCDSGKSEEAVKACFDLSDILRYASSYATSVVSVEDEIRNLEAYFSIMKARYRQRLCYSIVCEKETVGYSLPKLTLQPLAENAIKYSLAEIEEVVIKISVQMRKDTLCIAVIDNGCGINKQVKDEITEKYKMYSQIKQFDELHDKIQFGGMGLVGTLVRLKLLFGDKFSFEITGHNENCGATILLKVNFGVE